MSCIRSLVAVSFLASIGVSTAVTAQEMISDTTARKQPLTTWGVQFEEFEYRYSDDDEELGVWDADAFYGTDELKLRWISKGEYSLEERAYESLENQLVGQIPISKFFDAKAGVRFDTPEGPDRTYAVLGVAGLAPQWFEIDANLYVSKDGDTSAELDAEYELLLTNYWILSATLDATVAFSEDREIGIGKGLVSTETGLRLRYDLIDRAFSPYVGVVHERKYGDSADFAEADGGSTADWFAVIGARIAL
ncbi:copper resistance protein B [Alcanivorax marinus]|uniref:Copper resistance protein B n=3 Tax=Alloalcanivorax TaxID=3020832 RepID=A0A9Q3UPV9_9GAMM|nr:MULTISPECIES: copper resistance protein B [Alloalcanivorax]ASK33896.1 copper resistance protein B [Alcanivorax sp. N3-2A]ERS11029.1 copper resistance protein B [Alcanivorax sp. PN-3]KYZ86397.1 copper resistance protein CopB [Alcanivorax sp. KX64203]MCH2559220.1 copper resistance protein B [Alcanivorax sp.]MBM7335376.1 copper resistance protein B [Alloalcanivorax marinus]|tara:strand:+ start:5038 stop:5787 length:750 start_codon:yes stop_codon:yes gene_type:complete